MADDAYEILLSTLPVNLTAGQTATPDSTRLATPYREAWVCTEIDFLLLFAHTDAFARNFGGTIRAKFTLGPIFMTNGFIPVWNFGTSLDQSQEVQLDSNDVIGGGSGLTANYFRWRLPDPLYVAAGASILTTLQRANDNSGGTVIATVSMRGQTLPADHKPPEVVKVPYVSSFIHPTGQTASRNGELDFQNIFDSPLSVQRFIGRVQKLISGDVLLDDFEDTTVTTKVNDGRRDLIKGFIPFYDLFFALDRAWTFGALLQPKEAFYYQLVTVPTNYTPMISMIGTREVKL